MTDYNIRVDSSWQHTRMMPNMCRIPNGTIYIVGDESGANSCRVYKSTDGGVIWSDDVQFFSGGYGGFNVGMWGGTGNKIYCMSESNLGDTSWGLFFFRAGDGIIEAQDIALLDTGRELAEENLSYSAPVTLVERGSDLIAFFITDPGDTTNYRIDRKDSGDDGDTWGSVTIYDSDVRATGPSAAIFSTISDADNTIHIVYKAGGTASGMSAYIKHLKIESDETATITTIDSDIADYLMFPFGIEYDNINDMTVTLYHNNVPNETSYAYYESGSWTTALLEIENVQWSTSYVLTRLSDDTIWIMKVPYIPDIDGGCVRRWKWDGVAKTFVKQPMIDIAYPKPDGHGGRKFFGMYGPNPAARLAYPDFAYNGFPGGAYFSYTARVVDFGLRPERIEYSLTDAGLEISMELGAVLPTVASILRYIEHGLSKQ